MSREACSGASIVFEAYELRIPEQKRFDFFFTFRRHVFKSYLQKERSLLLNWRVWVDYVKFAKKREFYSRG